jgi:hypothetical protein
MAESEFGRLSPNAGTDMVGSPQDRGPDYSINARDDGLRYHPLRFVSPAERPAAPEPPYVAPAPPPTEAELRQRLLDAGEKLQAAQQAVEAAEAAHLRAKSNRHDAEVQLATFNNLEDEIAASVTEQLRSSAGKPDMMRFNDRLQARTLAQAALLGAQTAEIELMGENAQATQRWQEAQRVERVHALHPVLLLAREQLRPEMERLEARLGALRQAFRRGDDEAPWAGVAQALRDDPMGASLQVTVGDEPEPEAPKLVPISAWATPQTIKLARPVGAPDDFDAQEMSVAEYHQHRLREIRAGQPSGAMAEAAALAAARKGVG